MLLGGPFVYWFGPKPRICIYNYELVKQILANKSGHFMKNDAHPTFLAMFGKGLVMVEGADWVRHRRVVNPAFAMDKLKVNAYNSKFSSNSKPYARLLAKI
jgi:PHYB activation tagged suppressor 1